MEIQQSVELEKTEFVAVKDELETLQDLDSWKDVKDPLSLVTLKEEAEDEEINAEPQSFHAEVSFETDLKVEEFKLEKTCDGNNDELIADRTIENQVNEDSKAHSDNCEHGPEVQTTSLAEEQHISYPTEDMSPHMQSIKTLLQDGNADESGREPKNHLPVHSTPVKIIQKTFPCSICTETFPSASSRNQHVRMHSGKIFFECSWCEKRFDFKCKLKVHERMHTGEKPYACDKCPQRFSWSSTLQSHLRIHAGTNPYVCDLCRRRFSTKEMVELHLRTHAGEKPYVCDVCSKAFPRMYALKRHKLTHNRKKLYKCEMCYKSFNDKYYLCQHVRRIHDA